MFDIISKKHFWRQYFEICAKYEVNQGQSGGTPTVRR